MVIFFLKKNSIKKESPKILDFFLKPESQTDTINIKPTNNYKDFLETVFHEIDHALDAKKYGKKKLSRKNGWKGIKIVESNEQVDFDDDDD